MMKSWIAAMMGSPFRGVTRFFLTDMSSRASVRASSVCGTSVQNNECFDLIQKKKGTYVNSFRRRQNRHCKGYRHIRLTGTFAKA